MIRFQLVADHSSAFGVKRLCRLLGLARSGFYYWLRTAAARDARAAPDTALAVRIRKIHADSRGTYGSPRVAAELREAGDRVNRKRIEWVTRRHGIVGVHLRRRHRTTLADPAAAKAADLIGRDLTYLPVAGAKPLYFATVIDPCSRRPAG